jgi:histone deacetylase 1/2
MDNANSREYLEKIRVQVIENLKRTTFAPSVQMQDVPRDSLAMNDEDEAAMDDLDEDENPDRRRTQRRFDKYIEKDGELSDSEDEEMNEANGIRKQPGTRKRRNRMDFRHLNDFNDSGMDSNIATPLAGSSLPDNDVDEDMLDQQSQRRLKRHRQKVPRTDPRPFRESNHLK